MLLPRQESRCLNTFADLFYGLLDEKTNAFIRQFELYRFTHEIPNICENILFFYGEYLTKLKGFFKRNNDRVIHGGLHLIKLREKIQ